MGGMFSVESFSLTYISTFSLGLVDHWSFCGVKATKRMGINSHHVVGDKVSHGIPKTCVLALNQVSHANTHDINQRNKIKFNEYFGKTFVWRLQRWNCDGKRDKKKRECNHKVNILLISTNKEFSSKKSSCLGRNSQLRRFTWQVWRCGRTQPNSSPTDMTVLQNVSSPKGGSWCFRETPTYLIS